MAEYVEKWGDDVESAVELALKDLKLTRDEVVVTVLEQPSRGFLGLFGVNSKNSSRAQPRELRKTRKKLSEPEERRRQNPA